MLVAASAPSGNSPLVDGSRPDVDEDVDDSARSSASPVSLTFSSPTGSPALQPKRSAPSCADLGTRRDRGETPARTQLGSSFTYRAYDRDSLSAPDEPSDSSSAGTLGPEFLADLSHPRRIVRVFVALALTLIGLLWPAPYIGWAWCSMWFAPAAVLLAFAGMQRQSRRVVMICALPTAIGLVLAVLSAFQVAARTGGAATVAGIVIASLVTSLLAALLGRPPGAV
jgi:hypothetical protein